MSKDLKQLYYVMLKTGFRPNHINYTDDSVEIVFRLINPSAYNPMSKFYKIPYSDISIMLRQQ